MNQPETTIPFMEPLHILGSGSIGLLFASNMRMAFPSFPLTVLLRPHHESKLQSLEERSKHRRYMEVCIQRSGRPCMVHLPAEIIGTSESSIRNVLLTTKAPDAAAAIKSIAHRLETNARIIILCNGALSVKEEVNEVLTSVSLPGGGHAIYLASTTHGAFRHDDDSELYHVVHAGLGKTYVENFDSLARLWDQSGLVAKSISKKEMNTLLFHKLAANCVINPLTALLQCENGQLLQEPLYQKMVDPLLEEVACVAKATNKDAQQHTGDDKQLSFQELKSFVLDVIADTAQNKSSMLQDVMRNRPTEIEYLNGYVVRKGIEFVLDTPANHEMCNRVKNLTTA